MLKWNFRSKAQLRSLYWIVVVLLFVGIILPVFFFFYFDASKVRQMIIEQFNTENFVVTIDGGVFPKTWHGLSLELSNLGVKDKNNQELINVRNVSCQLSWLDLIVGQYKVKRLSLNGIMLNSKGIESADLHKLLNVSQVNNSVFRDLRYLNLYNINSNDSGKYKISDGSLQISQIGNDAQFDLTTEFGESQSHLIINGRVGTFNSKEVNFDDFDIKVSTPSGDLNLQSKASYQIASQTIFLDKINGNLNSTLYIGDIAVDSILFSWRNLIAQNIALRLYTKNDAVVQKLVANIQQLTTPDFNLVYMNNVDLDYNLSKDKNKLNVNSSLKRINLDMDSNITASGCSNKILINSPKLKNNVLSANLSGECAYLAKDDRVSLDLSGDLNNAKAKLNLQIENNESIPYINIMGSVDDLDFSRISVDKADILPLYSDNSELPFSWLGMFNMDADLSLNHFKLDRISLDDVQAKFSITENELDIKELKAGIYSGNLSAQAKVKKISTGYDISSVQTIHNLQLQNLFMNLFNISAISGKGNVDVNVIANNVLSYDDIRKRLSGAIAINASQGAFEGVDFDLFLHPNSLTGFKTKKMTVFTSLSAKFNFESGISSAGTLSFSSPNVLATGGGSIDFIKSLLDYKLNIKSSLPKNADKVQSVLIPVAINGDLFAPQINIQNIELKGQQVHPKVNKKKKY